MKKCLIIMFMVISATGFAQHKAFQAGFRGGLGAAWLTGDMAEFEKDGLTLGGSWGFVVDAYLMEGYSVNTGFNVLYINSKFISEGDSILPDGTVTKGKFNIELKARYIEIPVTFTMKTKEINDFFRIYGQIGAGLGILFKTSGNNGENYYNRIRVSLLLGTGLEFPLTGSTYLRTGVRFDNAFLPAFDYGNLKGKNQILEFNIAVIF